MLFSDILIFSKTGPLEPGLSETPTKIQKIKVRQRECDVILTLIKNSSVVNRDFSNSFDLQKYTLQLQYKHKIVLDVHKLTKNTPSKTALFFSSVNPSCTIISTNLFRVKLWGFQALINH